MAGGLTSTSSCIFLLSPDSGNNCLVNTKLENAQLKYTVHYKKKSYDTHSTPIVQETVQIWGTPNYCHGKLLRMSDILWHKNANRIIIPQGNFKVLLLSNIVCSFRLP